MWYYTQRTCLWLQELGFNNNFILIETKKVMEQSYQMDILGEKMDACWGKHKMFSYVEKCSEHGYYRIVLRWGNGCGYQMNVIIICPIVVVDIYVFDDV